MSIKHFLENTNTFCNNLEKSIIDYRKSIEFCFKLINKKKNNEKIEIRLSNFHEEYDETVFMFTEDQMRILRDRLNEELEKIEDEEI